MNSFCYCFIHDREYRLVYPRPTEDLQNKVFHIGNVANVKFPVIEGVSSFRYIQGI